MCVAPLGGYSVNCDTFLGTTDGFVARADGDAVNCIHVCALKCALKVHKETGYVRQSISAYTTSHSSHSADGAVAPIDSMRMVGTSDGLNTQTANGTSSSNMRSSLV